MLYLGCLVFVLPYQLCD